MSVAAPILLFDENLSRSLPKRIADLFPRSLHVYSCGLGSEDDWIVWEYAKVGGLAIVTQDEDFRHLSLTFGSPPKVVLVGLKDVPAVQVESLIRWRHADLLTFFGDPTWDLFDLI